jgi:hypothetical protein
MRKYNPLFWDLNKIYPSRVNFTVPQTSAARLGFDETKVSTTDENC